MAVAYKLYNEQNVYKVKLPQIICISQMGFITKEIDISHKVKIT